MAVSNFGNAPWGRTVIGKVLYPDPNDACISLTLRLGEDSFNELLETEAPIIIADRGGCSLVMKALNAQNAGAKLLMIVDDREEDDNYTMPVKDGQSKFEAQIFG